MKKILSTKDLLRLISEAVGQDKRELMLQGAHFSEIDLRFTEVPISLNLDDCIIDGDFLMIGAHFGGAYISLDRAQIGGSFSLSGMDVSSHRIADGIGLFLRGAKVNGTLWLRGTKINTLCMYATDFGSGKASSDVAGLLSLGGTQINRIFLAPREGELEDIQRLKEEARTRRLAEDA